MNHESFSGTLWYRMYLWYMLMFQSVSPEVSVQLFRHDAVEASGTLEGLPSALQPLAEEGLIVLHTETGQDGWVSNKALIQNKVCLSRIRISIIKIRQIFLFRVSSGQGKVREIPDLAKVRENSGNFVEGQGKSEYWKKVREKSGNLHLMQSKL